MITYKDFPTLLHTSFTRKDAPKDLPFEVESEAVRNGLAQNTAFRELLPTIAILNEMAPGLKNFHLPERDFHRIEYNDQIRQKHFQQFQNRLPTDHQYGTICFKDGGQYLYMYLDQANANRFKKSSYPYICTALLTKDMLVGIEEGYFTDQGLSVDDTGIYSGGMNIGGYISFVTISLDYLRTHKTRMLKGENKTKELVYTL